MDEEERGLLERGVSALERLADDPVLQLETGPPVCPHCEKENPVVRVEERAAQGKLGSWLLQAHCLNCNFVFYALPTQWETTKSIEEARMLVTERAEVHNGKHG